MSIVIDKNLFTLHTRSTSYQMKVDPWDTPVAKGDGVGGRSSKIPADQFDAPPLVDALGDDLAVEAGGALPH